MAGATRSIRDLELHTFAFYIRREAALSGAVWGLVGGLGAAVLINLAAWLWPLLTWWPRLALSAGLPALIALLVFLGVYVYPRSALSIARIADARLGLRARLATALEIQAGQIVVLPDLAKRQRADAVRAAGAADPAVAFRLRVARRPALIAAILLVCLILGLALPNPQEKVIAQHQADQQIIQEQVERLEQVRKQIAENPNLAFEDKQALLKELDDTIQDLKEGNLSKEQALARLSEAEERLQAQLGEEALAQKAALDQAGQEAMQGSSTQEIGQALKQGDYQGAAQKLEILGQNLDQMSAAEQQVTAERLDAMADAVQATNPELAQALRDAAEALRQGDLAAAQEALQQAADLTAQAGQEVAAQQAAQQALAQIQEGKQQVVQSGQQGQQGQQGQNTGSGSGSGDANGQQGGQGTPQSPTGPIDQNQPGDGGQKAYDPVYVPERLGPGEGGQTVVVPPTGEDGSPVGETEGGPHEPGQALVPYNQVYSDYQAQAASALENSYIPLGVKDYVREYFSALEPNP